MFQPTKIWLDDERDSPNCEEWIRCYWPVEVIGWLEGSGVITEISLDHDLGDDGRGTGYDVLVWIEEKVVTDPTFKPPIIKIHTANPAARIRMEAALSTIARISRGRE